MVQPPALEFEASPTAEGPSVLEHLQRKTKPKMLKPERLPNQYR